MSNLIDFAIKELDAIGEVGGELSLREQILELVTCFSRQGHSGSTAAYTIAALEKLLRFKPLAPLTGNDDEWVECVDGIFQNKRCSTVFKENGIAYDIDGKVFVEPNGTAYTSIESRVNVTFPYTPHTEYVDVDADGNIRD